MRLERALLFTIAAHGVAMLAMATLLLPGMPGAGLADSTLRVQYIAAHPWLWRLGWLPWQVTALSDVLLALALWRTPWIPRAPAAVVALLTVTAVIPDQAGQLAWITEGIRRAQQSPATYLAYEARIFRWTAVWGATLYTLGALGWTWCFVVAGTWSRALTALSLVLWPCFLAISVGPVLGMSAGMVAAGNATAFVGLELWLALVTEAVLRRSQPRSPVGHWARWRHPRWSWLNPLAESRFLHACGQALPRVALRSDIRDVVYINYIVAAERLTPLLPPGLTLDRLGPDGNQAVFTFLTYRHGHFGPRLLGRMRRLCPSPVQSNWRIHVRDARTQTRGVYFLSTTITSTTYALAARWLAEGLPMHVLDEATVGSTGGGAIVVRLAPGAGSAPDARATLRPGAIPDDGPWRACFASWQEFLAYVVPQDRALVPQPGRNRVCHLEIKLGIPLDSCQPLQGPVDSAAAHAIAGDATPIAFHVPRARFLFAGKTFVRPD